MSDAAPNRVSHPRKRILLGQLGARGDCLYATAVARQIRADYRDCHLTWAVGSMFREVIESNPHIDSIWEFPMKDQSEMMSAWELFRAQAESALRSGEFDEIFLTQLSPDNFGNFDGTIRASMLRGYPRKISVPVAPVVKLTDNQVKNVREFAERHNIQDHPCVILFEFMSSSGQTFVNTEFALKVSADILRRLPGARVVLASHVRIETGDSRIIDGSELTFVENLEFSKYCSMLLGCSSGISWLFTSDRAKPMPKIQLLRRETSVYASMVHDHEHFGLPTDSIIEMTECAPARVAECVEATMNEGVAMARKRFHEGIQPDFVYFAQILRFAYSRSGIAAVLGALRNTIGRYGLRWKLVVVIANMFFGFLRNRAIAIFSRRA